MESKKIIEGNNYYPQLDGIRGIAIIMVMCYHYFPNSSICNFGWTGVDLFFVLSGFLISSRLLPYLDDKKLFQKFFRNRVLRIMPLYFGFLILFFVCWFILASKETISIYPFYTIHWWIFFVFIQNWIFISNYPPSATHLNHFWSIATEEQFYLFFPFFVLLIKQRKKLLLIASALVVSIMIYRSLYFHCFIINNEYEKVYWNTFFRMDSFLIGCILFLLLEKCIILVKIRKHLNYLMGSLILILVAGILFSGTADKNAPFFTTFGYTIIAIIYAYFIYIALSKRSSVINTITLNPFLRYTGKISYGIYIFHWPIYIAGFVLFRKLFNYLHFTITEDWLGFINAMGCIFITFFISHVSFKYFESKFLKLKVRNNR